MIKKVKNKTYENRLNALKILLSLIKILEFYLKIKKRHLVNVNLEHKDKKSLIRENKKLLNNKDGI